MFEDQLHENYVRTTYWVDLPDGSVPLRIGEASLRLEALLASEGVDEWALITAHNPGSRECAPEANAQAQDRLRAELARMGFRLWEGRSVSDAGDWPVEDSLLVLGISLDQAKGIGRQFGQNAVLAGRRATGPELQWV
jgi:hypothetical protein